MVLVAMFVVAAPVAVAQTPVTDQYAEPEGPLPVDEGGGAVPADDQGAAPAGVAARPPVRVLDRRPAAGGAGLPFTGAQLSLIALIGLALLALGMLGRAATRQRAASSAS